MNRHQHFVTLGQAYAYSRDSRYADAFASQLTSWIAANPPRLGVNWASSLEVSYRAISWLWALQLFVEAPQLTDSLLATALESLRRHGAHIERYLSTYYSPNTHLTGEALGLLYLGTALPIFEAAESWRRLGWNILRDQLFRQTRPDGTYFEQALYYHRYTADIYHHALVLARRERLGARRCDARARRAAGRVPRARGPSRRHRSTHRGRRRRPPDAPRRTADARRAADAHDGRSAVRSERHALRRRHRRRGVPLAARRRRARGRWRRVRPKSPSEGSRGFPDGGFYVLRDGWSASATWALVDGGPHGSLNCGHAHADALALEVATNGRPVLTDSGTFSYTGIGARAIPGVVVAQHGDGGRRELVADGWSVSLASRRADDGARVASSPGADFWRGSHDGYARLDRSGDSRAERSPGARTLSRRARCARRIGRARAHRALALRAGSRARAGGDARRRDRGSARTERDSAPALRVGRRPAGRLGRRGDRRRTGRSARPPTSASRSPAPAGSASVRCSSRARRMRDS